MTAVGVTMAKRTNVNTVKITAEMWQQLKIIHAVTGEKMNEYVARVLAPILAKDHKKALNVLASRGKDDAD